MSYWERRRHKYHQMPLAIASDLDCGSREGYTRVYINCRAPRAFTLVQSRLFCWRACLTGRATCFDCSKRAHFRFSPAREAREQAIPCILTHYLLLLVFLLLLRRFPAAPLLRQPVNRAKPRCAIYSRSTFLLHVVSCVRACLRARFFSLYVREMAREFSHY